MIGKAYLILYNLIMALGWGYVFVLAYEKRFDLPNLWKHIELPLKIFQTGALLEVVHAAVGLVRSNVFLTFFQVMSRVFVLWCVLEISPPSTVCIGLPICLIAWEITEVIRYGYYFFSLIGMPHLLVWLRYTLFIILYPIGISGELICMYYALDYIKEQKLWTYSLPNALNFSFDYQYAMVLVMLSYIPIFPQLYGHMFTQRRKIIGGRDSKSKVN